MSDVIHLDYFFLDGKRVLCVSLTGLSLVSYPVTTYNKTKGKAATPKPTAVVQTHILVIATTRSRRVGPTTSLFSFFRCFWCLDILASTILFIR